MAIDSISLRKLLFFFDADASLQTSKLREEIRRAISKRNGRKKKGGDFHVPFWSDAKRHVLGELDLSDQAEARIALHDGRSRLYPELAVGFLTWWEEKRRWRNEPFEVIEPSLHGRCTIPALGDVKVEGPLALRGGDGSYFVVYPYFAEEPVLRTENARLGLWLLSQALPDVPVESLRILDVLRSRSFGVVDCPFLGDEAELFRSRYELVMARYEKLLLEYPLAA